MTNDDRRLIEDYLPIQAISAEASCGGRWTLPILSPAARATAI